MNSTDVLDQSVLNWPSFDPDYTAPWFFKQFSPLRSHETTSFLMAMAALSDGYDMRFFRSQREARFHSPVMGLATKEANFFEVSDGRKRCIFSSSQSEKLNVPSVKLVTDKLRSKEILHRKRLNTPAGGAVSIDNLDLLHRFAAAGDRRPCGLHVGRSLRRGHGQRVQQPPVGSRGPGPRRRVRRGAPTSDL